jgi:hypothetical protein
LTNQYNYNLKIKNFLKFWRRLSFSFYQVYIAGKLQKLLMEMFVENITKNKVIWTIIQARWSGFVYLLGGLQ